VAVDDIERLPVDTKQKKEMLIHAGSGTLQLSMKWTTTPTGRFMPGTSVTTSKGDMNMKVLKPGGKAL
jgi:hypothetical protein